MPITYMFACHVTLLHSPFVNAAHEHTYSVTSNYCTRYSLTRLQYTILSRYITARVILNTNIISVTLYSRIIVYYVIFF